MIRALIVAAALVLAPVAALAQSLTVTNAEGRVTTFTPEALAALPQAEAKLGSKAVYVGASLSAILREAGVPQGPRLHGKPMQAFIVVTGADGYRAVLSIAETDPSFRDAPIILVDRMKTGPLKPEEGSLRLVIDADARPDRGVRQVESIKVVVAP
ncbi:MAG: molybdopterin-dependent oxidoreductase [Caulobacterales bacterium]|nr:molybdopterin-dependent oxidoreductase [Caulobacterales bacterium]